MLMVKHYVAASTIQGVGLFAGENIKKGQVVYEWGKSPFVTYIPNKVIEDLPEGMKESIQKYSYNGRDEDHLEDGVWFDTDDGRFMNHSDSSNLKYISKTQQYIAIKEIQLGDEITCNYSDFEEFSGFKGGELNG